MKKFSSIWLIASIAILPCVLDMENLWCCLIIAVSLVLSFRSFRKHNPEYIIH